MLIFSARQHSVPDRYSGGVRCCVVLILWWVLWVGELGEWSPWWCGWVSRRWSFAIDPSTSPRWELGRRTNPAGRSSSRIRSDLFVPEAGDPITRPQEEALIEPLRQRA